MISLKNICAIDSLFCHLYFCLFRNKMILLKHNFLNVSLLQRALGEAPSHESKMEE